MSLLRMRETSKIAETEGSKPKPGMHVGSGRSENKLTKKACLYMVRWMNGQSRKMGECEVSPTALPFYSDCD